MAMRMVSKPNQVWYVHTKCTGLYNKSLLVSSYQSQHLTDLTGFLPGSCPSQHLTDLTVIFMTVQDNIAWPNA